MVEQHTPQPGAGQMAEYLGKMFGMPSPDKVMGELQRLNNNIELIQPDIRSLAKSMEGMSGADLRNLTAVLGNLKAGDMIRMLNEFTQLGKQIYGKLWGEK